MWNIQIENNVKRGNKLEENVKKAYAMIFKEFCPIQIQNIIKEHPEYDSILNYPLKLMGEIYQLIQNPV